MLLRRARVVVVEDTVGGFVRVDVDREARVDVEVEELVGVELEALVEVEVGQPNCSCLQHHAFLKADQPLRQLVASALQS